MAAGVQILRRGADVILVAGLATGLLVILAGIVVGSPLVSLLPLAAVAVAPVAVWIGSRDHRILVLLVVSFAAVARYGEGFDLEEVVYAAALWGFLGFWFLRKVTVDIHGIARSKVDLFLFLYLLYSAFSLSFSVLNGAEAATMVSEFYAVAVMLIYFPLRDAFAESPERGRQLLYALLALAAIIALRNFWWYATRLNSAEHLWQLATGRVVMNEHILLPAAIAGLLLYLNVPRARSKIAVFTVAVLPVAGIIIGQSRALWLSFLLALFVVFIFVQRVHKTTIMRAGVVGVVSLGIAAYALLGGELFTLVGAGLIDRFFSLGTAATEDVSLVNRFNEMKAAFAAAVNVPVTGHGFGVPYKYYSMVYKATHETTFVHHGYLGLFYRHGLIGLVLFGGFFIGTIYTNSKALLTKAVPANERMFAILAAAVFTSIALSANSESPFGATDKTLMMAFVAAAGAGTLQRQRRLNSSDKTPL